MDPMDLMDLSLAELMNLSLADLIDLSRRAPGG
jgi:hypothetical protein